MDDPGLIEGKEVKRQKTCEGVHRNITLDNPDNLPKPVSKLSKLYGPVCSA